MSKNNFNIILYSVFAFYLACLIITLICIMRICGSMSPADDNDDNPWDVKGDNASSPKKTTKQDDMGPFGRGRPQNQPPEFSKVVNEFQKRFRDSRGGSGGSGPSGVPPQHQGKVFVGIFGLIIAVWLGSGFYSVADGEVAVVLRFGKFARTSLPGLRYRLPSPIEQEIIRNVSTVNIIQSSSQEGGDIEHNLTLTGDENMVITNYTISWKIRDIEDYLFKVRNPDQTIRAAAESALRDAMGQTTARKALTEGRAEIGAMALETLQKILDSYGAGIQITQFQLQRIEPPAQVVEAFNDLQSSLADADRSSNEAQSYSNDILPKARGQAESVLRNAEAYAEEVVAKAEGETSRFTQVLQANRKNPRITRIRMHREVMEQMLKQANVSIVDHDLSKSLQNYNQLTPAPLLHKREGA